MWQGNFLQQVNHQEGVIYELYNNLKITKIFEKYLQAMNQSNKYKPNTNPS